MATTKSTRVLDIKSVQNILNSRKVTVQASEVGDFIKFSIAQVSNPLPVKNAAGEFVPEAGGSGAMLHKRIITLKANSAVAVNNARNNDTLRAGFALEQEGKADEATEKYSEYLDKCRLSFSVLSTARNFDAFAEGDRIQGQVQEVKTDKGSLLTLDPTTVTAIEASNGTATSIDIFAMVASVEKAATE